MTTFLPLPIVIILLASLLALVHGRPFLNKRISITRAAHVLLLAPLAAFAFILAQLPAISDGSALTWRVAWLPSAGLSLGLYLDNLGALFALLVTGIGTMVILYTGYYFKDDQSAWRFLCYMLLFMASMLGLVMSGDVLTLFIFWEGTSITSFLLVAYKTKYADARSGGFKALFITGGGGIALLVGLLIAANLAGSTEFATILSSGDVLRASPYYTLMLLLVVTGAFTKSAQWPTHIWLPAAMTAPTPASAYLHSATMVKAGIFLLARVNPALGETELWFWLLGLAGMTTMVAGAFLGMKQNDLKALLAYSTISQLGILVMLIAQDTEIAFKALVIGVVAHALYKSALFLLAGIVDHETGTRDLRRLGGLRRVMPVTFWLTAIAALSLAGLPPLFGFLAKETLLATAVHPSLPEFLAWFFPTTVVIAAAFKIVQSGLLVLDPFTGRPKDDSIHAHEAPKLMLLAPAIPALLSLSVGLLPDLGAVATFFGLAAADAYGNEVKVSFALWTGLNIPLALSAVAIAGGIVLAAYRAPLRAWLAGKGERLTFNTVFDGILAGIDRGAFWATRLQHGRLRTYLAIIIAAMVGLVALFSGLPWPADVTLTWPQPDAAGVTGMMRLISLAVIIFTSIASVLLRRDSFAIFALGVSGLGVAVFMVLEPAPDVALVQIVVDILAMVILVLTLTRLPRQQRRLAQGVTFLQSRLGLARDLLVSLAGGAVVAVIAFNALISRPRDSLMTPFYEESAKPLAGAKDVVGAIIVDFRALDTLIEIAVFGMAGIGVYTLLRYAALKYGDDLKLSAPPSRLLPLQDFGVWQASSFMRALAYVALPLALVVAATHVMYGHDQPGDGFTAGVIISLAVGFWYIIFGYEQTRERLTWLQGGPLIGAGLLLVAVSGALALLFTGSFLGHVNFGAMLGLPLPEGLSLSTALLFEIAICLAVVGSLSYMLNTLGAPARSQAKQRRLQRSSDPQKE